MLCLTFCPSNMVYKNVILNWQWLFLCIVLVQGRNLRDSQYCNGLEFRTKRSVALDEEHLCYMSPKAFPRQLQVLNSSSNIGIVIDSMREQFAILNGETAQGLIIDKPLMIGVMIENGGWSIYQQSLNEYIKGCNVSQLIMDNKGRTFNLEDQRSTGEVRSYIRSNLNSFGEDLVQRMAEAGGGIIKLVIDLFGFIMHPLKNVLGPVINLLADGWTVFKGGFYALLNIFKWMGMLVSSIAGGLVKLIAKAVRFPLNLIITALDGARAFFYMLKELTIHFDLIKILRAILTVPASIARFIAGLGGKIMRGVTGFFNVVANTFDFANRGITYGIQAFTNILLRFFGRSPPNYAEVQKSTTDLLTIAEDQQQRFQNDEGFGPYKQFLGCVSGNNNYDVEGINVGNLVKGLTDSSGAGISNVMNIFNTLKPVVPFKVSVPNLLVSTVKLLNTTNGVSYIKKLIPSIDVPHDSTKNITKNIAGAVIKYKNNGPDLKYLHALPPSLMLLKLPVVSSIFHEIQKALQKYDNSTNLNNLLDQHIAGSEVKEWTTKAMKLPIE